MALPRVNAPFPEVGPCVGKRKATGVDRPSGLRTHGRGMRLTGLFGDWGALTPALSQCERDMVRVVGVG